MKTKSDLQITATAVGRVLKEALDPIKARLDALEAHAAELKYVGVWRQGEFRKGNFATHAGGIWHANRDTIDKPGESGDWTLAVKSGQPR